MLSQEVEERLAEHLVKRIEDTNTYILKKIGEAIKQISTLTPSQAHQIEQILKYGGTYEDIAKQLAKASGKNVKDIYKIFEKVAKDNKEFARQFYKYRGIGYIPYNKDTALQNMVRSIGDITAKEYLNIARTTGVGFLFEDINGQTYFKNIKDSYYEIIDRGILSISQGKETFDTEMRKIMKQLGNNGLVMYKSGRTRRLDSAVRMSLLDGIREVNNETTKRFGEEYDADGVEISVHANPAPDHADVQGRQFSTIKPSENELSEWEKLEAGEIAKDYNGVSRQLEHSKNGSYRQISQYNCYHRISNVVLGVSKPMYTEEQLNEIQETNLKGFEYEGKHYTMYEGTQLQRRIETEIRKAKDTQILARSAGDNDLVGQSQLKITQLTHKYNELCNVSGLAPVKQRMSVSGYRRVKV